MIIDVHAHLVTPMSVMGIRTALQISGGQHSIDWIKQTYLSQDELDKAALNNVTLMDQVGTDVQILSPRPFALMHSHRRFEDVNLWIQLQNDIIHRNIQQHSTRFRGMGALPQVSGQPIEVTFDEIDRCVNDMGFVGLLVNPDPSEGLGTSPRLGDPYWYPLWEKLVSLDVPALIHSASCCGRETYDEHFATEESLAITSVAHSDVFQRFPGLKLIIAHGGGGIPYQIGRWRSHWLTTHAAKKPHIGKYLKDLQAAAKAGEKHPVRPDDLTTFDDILRKFYFDAVLHDSGSLELLFKRIGVDRCMFGTERPGSGGGLDLESGRPMDDLKFTIDRLAMLSPEDRYAIFEGNARKVFTRLDKLGR